MKRESNDSITWRESMRVKCYGKFTLNFNASKIFPLLCPVEEYKWFPGWGCEMVFSQSGIAEKDAIFLTKEEDGIEAVQTVINYDPFKQVEFLIVKGRDSVERLSIFLREISKGTTELEWTTMCTAYSEIGREIAQRYNDETFKIFLEDRKRELNYYLEHHEMIT